MNKQRILVINPRTAFTKLAVYDHNKLVYLNKISHSEEELSPFKSIMDQHEYRKAIVLKELKNADIDLNSIGIVAARGGMVKPLKSGVYRISDQLVQDLLNNPMGEDSVNLGCVIAHEMGKELPNAEAYTSNPIVVDELIDEARISGHPDFERRSVFHALNQKAIARKFAKTNMKKYEDINLVVAHLGVGITIGAHRKGRVIDVNQGFDGGGPFTPKRAGTLPVGDLIRMAYSGKYTKEEMLAKEMGEGGLKAYLGTESAYEAEQMMHKGDEKAGLILRAMVHQIVKAIGAYAAVLKCDIDAILITGGIANSRWFTERIIDHVKNIAPVHVYPGGDEMEALANNVMMALEGEIPMRDYE
jgi:butyrate kinase